MSHLEIRGVGLLTAVEYRQQPPNEHDLTEPGVTYEMATCDKSFYRITITRVALDGEIQDGLRKALPHGATLIIEEDSRRDYEYSLNSNEGILCMDPNDPEGYFSQMCV